ncbi:hemolysin activation protein, partial [Campylobacter coli]|nr:hemolysin activation protein [Campylobacter coli]
DFDNSGYKLKENIKLVPIFL